MVEEVRETRNQISRRERYILPGYIFLLILASLVIVDLATHDFSKRTKLQQATLGLSDEMVEVLTVYKHRTDQQMAELNQMAQ